MSNTLREYESIEELTGRNMTVTAFVGGKFGHSVQFTINGEYCGLAENQVRDLIAVLQKRVRSIKAYRATSVNLDVVIGPKVKVV